MHGTQKGEILRCSGYVAPARVRITDKYRILCIHPLRDAILYVMLFSFLPTQAHRNVAYSIAMCKGDLGDDYRYGHGVRAASRENPTAFKRIGRLAVIMLADPKRAAKYMREVERVL